MASHPFFLTLPSNASMEHFPDNTLTHYTVKLPKHVSLEGDWEVALMEIHYPFSWFNVMPRRNLMVFTDERGRKVIKIPDGYYSDFEDLNNAFKRQGLPSGVQLNHDKLSKKVTLDIREGGRLYLFSGLAEMLGFHPNAILTQSQEAPNPTHLQNIPSLYVYCDLLEGQMVGDIHAPLLRVVNVNGTHGEMINHTFHTPYFLPLRHREFETVEIYIRDDMGQKVPFQGGKVIVTLAFRKRRPTLL